MITEWHGLMRMLHYIECSIQAWRDELNTFVGVIVILNVIKKAAFKWQPFIEWSPTVLVLS